MATENRNVDEKIHHFMARKSPWKTFSMTIAEHLVPSRDVKRKSAYISYEQTEWRGNNPVFTR